MLPIFHLEGQKIAVFGLGRSGMATARAAQKGGAEVYVYDGNPNSVMRATDEGFEFLDLRKDTAWSEIDQLIVSPGISHLYPHVHPIIDKAMSHGVIVDNDVSLFFKELSESYVGMEKPPKVIAITGSNGKSTITALTHHALTQLGFDAQMGGNIGRGVFDLDPPSSKTIYVLELSSYQTELALNLNPDIAIFSNLSADHLDRHAGMGGYFAAKMRLFTQSLPRAVIGVEEAEGRYLESHLSALGARTIPVSISGKLQRSKYIQVKKGYLSEWNKGRQVASLDLRDYQALPGQHNWQNAALVFGALRELTIAPKKIEAAMVSFGGLAHRCQLIGEKNGVRFFNDSKATNADAAAKALGAFQNIHWIVGGQAKEGGIESLRPYFENVKFAYLIGESAVEFAVTLENTPHQICHRMEDALHAIKSNVEEGDVVLLSPASASFDQYADFEKRGEAYISLVKSHFDV